MTASESPPASSSLPNIKSWISCSIWRERIVTFDPSWFTLTMGTGIIIQLLHFIPWPAYWLSNLGYAFWILDIILFTFFSIMGCSRLILYPKVALSVLGDFPQTSFLGAVPVSFDTITAGLIIYYNGNTRAMYVAEVFYWIGVTLSAAVGVGGVFAMYTSQGHHQIEEVTGVWLLAFIPMIVTAALGSTLAPYLLGNNTATILIVSILMLSLGLGLCFIITTIYFWRLMTCSLPARDAIVSCFIPVGPFGMGAFAILGLSLDLSRYITQHEFIFEESTTATPSTVNMAAIGQAIIWIGVILSFMLLGLATFFLLEALASVYAKIPNNFNIGIWGFVFPCGVYANAFCRLSTTLRNDGMKGWATACVVATILLWLMCAVVTTYKGVWQGKTFVAPGLQGWVEQNELETLRDQSKHMHPDQRLNAHAPPHVIPSDEVNGRQFHRDGTYRRLRPHRNQERGDENNSTV